VNASACARLGDLLARRDEDRLSLSEERLLREHLAACGPCAAEALRHDPVLLFSRDAGSEPLTPDARERFVGDVLAATSTLRAGKRLGTARRGVALRIAASLLLAASVAGVWLARDGGTPAPEGTSVPVALAADERTAPADTLPAIEEIGGAGAVVYQFPAARPGEATVVFVVDRNADI
jgi:hypothetical protein